MFIILFKKTLKFKYYYLAGGDSLIKVWNYKKSICINTFEKHEGKIWALEVSLP